MVYIIWYLGIDWWYCVGGLFFIDFFREKNGNILVLQWVVIKYFEL